MSKLLSSPSNEIVLMVNLVLKDARSVTCNNVKYLNQLTKVDILRTAHWKVKNLLPIKLVPQEEMFRIGLLNVLLEVKFQKNYASFNMDKGLYFNYVITKQGGMVCENITVGDVIVGMVPQLITDYAKLRQFFHFVAIRPFILTDFHIDSVYIF